MQKGLLNLPAPKNEYVLSLPEKQPEEDTQQMQREDDASDLLEQELQRKKERETKLLLERSTPLKRNLPRPTSIPKYKPAKLDASVPAHLQAEELLRSELEAILIHDAEIIPINPNNSVITHFDEWETFTDEELAEAKALLGEEAKLDEKGNPRELSEEKFLEAWTAAFEDIVYVPSQQKFKRASLADKSELVAAYQARFESLLGQMKKEATKAKKLEGRLNVYNGGYMVS